MFLLFNTVLHKGIKSLFSIGLLLIFFTHLSFAEKSNFDFFGNCGATQSATNENSMDGVGSFTTSSAGTFTYRLLDAANQEIDAGSLTGSNATVTWNDLKGGTYRVEVIGSNGTETCSFTIGLMNCSLGVTVADMTVACASDLGTLTAMPTNGVAPLTYAWSTGATTASLSDVAPGMYGVTVTDNAGCMANITGTITATSPTSVAVAIVSTTSATDFETNDGSLTYSISGGASTYNVIATNTYTNAQITQNGVGTGNVMLNLLPGNYSIVATDANGCTGTNTFQIGVTTCLFVLNDIADIPTACDIANNTFTAVSNNRGVEPITYAWVNTNPANPPFTATTTAISGLLPDTYTVTATDAVGCQSIKSGVVTGNHPLTLTCNVTQQNTVIGGAAGAASIVVGVGNPPYDATLYHNNQQISTFRIPSASTTDLNTLKTGQYRLNITDQSDCPITCNFEITEPACGVVIQLADLTLDCIETTGDLQATISGGTPPYIISWSNGMNTALNQNLSPGTYTITVKDQLNCEMSQSATIFTRDRDGDGYFTGCTTFPAGALQADCNDDDSSIFPGAPEICDGKDNDCNGQKDEIIINGQPCPAQVPVPTMSEWGLMVFGLLVLNLGAIVLLYRERLEGE